MAHFVKKMRRCLSTQVQIAKTLSAAINNNIGPVSARA
jgi:hypothetical protein